MKRRKLFTSAIALGALAGGWSAGASMTEPGVPPSQQAWGLLPVGSGIWQAWGSSEVSFLGLRLYRATLWVAGSEPEQSPLALALTYRRDIPRERLVSTTLDEMRRLGASDSLLARWRHALERAFPSVREGETITGIHVPGRGASFLHEGRHVADIADPEFARRFFAIWLDPRTRLPQAREALLLRPSQPKH